MTYLTVDTEIVPADDGWVEATVPTLRAYFRFLGETRRLAGSPAGASALLGELDEAAPRYPGAMRDESRYGVAKSFFVAMTRDGVDVSDQAAVDRWIADQPGPRVGTAPSGQQAEPDLAVLAAVASNITLPLVVLPSEAEIAETVRHLDMLIDAARLARWAGEGREVDDEAQLSESDARRAAAELDLRLVQEPFTTTSGMDPTDTHSQDVPTVWLMCYIAGFLELDGEVARPTERASSWPDVDDDDALEAWESVITSAVSVPDAPPGLGPAGEMVRALMAAMFMFLLRLYGSAPASAADFGAATAERLTHSLGTRTTELRTSTEFFVAAIVNRLSYLGVLERDGDQVELTPLGTWGIRRVVESIGCEAPAITSIGEADAEEMLDLCRVMDPDDAKESVAQWYSARDQDAAVAELVEVVHGSGALRMDALRALGFLGAAAVPPVRGLLAEPELRPYAIVWLNDNTGEQQLELTLREEQQLFVDRLSAANSDDEQLCCLGHLHEEEQKLVRAVHPDFLATLWRCEHPRTAQALEFVGRVHPDKHIAKTARRALFKLRSATPHQPGR